MVQGPDSMWRAIVQGTDVLVFGGGGHAKVVADIITESTATVGAFVVIEGALEAGTSGIPFLNESDVRKAAAGTRRFAALGIGDNTSRLRLMRELTDFELAALFHPSAVASRTAVFGRATVVCAGAIIQPDCVIGEAVIVNTGAIIEHDCAVGHGAHISPRAVLTGGVRVGELAWIGAGAVVLPGIQVGASAIVGAGAVVTRDVAAGSVIAGIPARILNANREKQPRDQA